MTQPKSGSEAGLSYRDIGTGSRLNGLHDNRRVAGRPLTVSTTAAGEPERLTASAISWDLFPELGVSPMLGAAS